MPAESDGVGWEELQNTVHTAQRSAKQHNTARMSHGGQPAAGTCRSLKQLTAQCCTWAGQVQEQPSLASRNSGASPCCRRTQCTHRWPACCRCPPAAPAHRPAKAVLLSAGEACSRMQGRGLAMTVMPCWLQQLACTEPAQRQAVLPSKRSCTHHRVVIGAIRGGRRGPAQGRAEITTFGSSISRGLGAGNRQVISSMNVWCLLRPPFSTLL